MNLQVLLNDHSEHMKGICTQMHVHIYVHMADEIHMDIYTQMYTCEIYMYTDICVYNPLFKQKFEDIHSLLFIAPVKF